MCFQIKAAVIKTVTMSFLKEFDTMHAGAMGKVVCNAFCYVFKEPDLSGKYSPSKLQSLMKRSLHDTDQVLTKLILINDKFDSYEDMDVLDPVVQDVLEIKNGIQMKLKELEESMDEIEKDMEMNFEEVDETGKDVGMFYKLSKDYYNSLEEYCRLDSMPMKLPLCIHYNSQETRVQIWKIQLCGWR